ncbi:MAG: hypothetical protein OMOMHJEC_03302 [Xanthomonadales bacterium]|nr:hypothetical protein [Xanthomonadales bacterium]
MDNYRRRQITVCAETQVRDAGITTFPVDPRIIAERAEIKVQAKPSDVQGASGWLVRSGNAFGILYATHIPNEGFQRFSIAHELGHYFLDGHPEHVFRDGEQHASMAGFGSKDSIEIEADHFAASLLMPPMLFRPAMDKFKDGLQAVVGLRALTQASLEATAIRYAEHTKAAVAVIVSAGRRIDYCVLSDELQEQKARRLSRGTLLPRRSATYRLNEDHAAILAGETISDEIAADEWFSDVRGTCTEEAIGLGLYGKTLTIITLDIDSVDDDAPAWNPKFRR